MKKMLLVYNPVSGDAKFKKRLDNVIEAFQRRKILITLYRTEKNETAENFFESVKVLKPSGIICAGGDGTLHRVINWLMRNEIKIPLGIIGSGTSNDFATYLQINEEEKYFDAIAENRTRLVDLGLVNEKEYFINVASAGFLTSIAHEVNSRQKNFLGKIAYYIHGLGEIPKFKSVKLKICADGKIFELEAFLFLVLNSPAVAGMKKVVNAAQIDDGKLDLIAIKNSSARKILELTKKIVSGSEIEDEENIFHIQAKNFEISAETELISDLDGEIGNLLPIKINCIPHAIKIFVNN